MKMIWFNFRGVTPNTLREIEFSFKKLLFIRLLFVKDKWSGILNIKIYRNTKWKFPDM